MSEQEPTKAFASILKEYETEYAWLLSLVTDPAGDRYLIEKSPEEREVEYREQLERTTIFLDFLGNPQDKFDSVHIAGTAGKGSVTTMIGAILQEAGLRVGIHTSPYLQVPNEKLLINGTMVSPSRFINLVKEFRPRYEKFTKKNPSLTPSYGEAWVALTHLYFAQEKVDWGIIETGMGGRFDPTNVLDPEIAVITNVDFDHVPQLGISLGEIAFHKAGIIKAGRPVVTAERKEKALKIIRDEANRQNAPLFCLGKELVSADRIDKSGSVIDIETPISSYHNVRVALPGIFQLENAALAVSAVDILGKIKGFSIEKEVVETALSSVGFPGRMEMVQENPVVILDGAHNPQKMQALADSMEKLYPEVKYSLVIGMLATKEAQPAIVQLLPQVQEVVATQPRVFGKPSLSPKEIETIVQEINPEIKVRTSDSVMEATQLLLEKADPDETILITGSLYMIGEARERWFPKEDLLWRAEYGDKPRT